jgi:serine protease Do
LLRFGRVPGRMRRAWVGLYPQPTESGIQVAGVVPEAPASRSGIHEGDVILAVNFREVTTRPELYQQMWQHEAGEPLRFTILRQGRRTVVEIMTVDRAEFYR